MNTLLQTNKLVNNATATAGGFFVDTTLQQFILKQPGKNREIRFLGKIFTPKEICYER